MEMDKEMYRPVNKLADLELALKKSMNQLMDIKVAFAEEMTKRKRIEQELQKIKTNTIHVQEEERKRLSRNLHDGIGQNLYSHLITINRLLSEMDHPLLQLMEKEATELIEEVREISWELRPSVLDDLGLVPAIRSLLARYSEHYMIDVYFECVLNRRLEINIELTIYRIIQEALTNVRKYAEVLAATVTVREMTDTIRVMIEDNGKGFDLENQSLGVGLFSMDERARTVNGELFIHAAPGKGTKIILEIPIF
ncbi:MAG: sensor histidine kinase [Bacillus sp. (in: Bacteria)]|nr:sensor histidine kinase [Bacillus sp. (in: firmicutes)]